MSTVFVHKQGADALQLQNTTGVAIVINQFLVLAGKCLKACEAVAISAIGGFHNLLGCVVEAADFVAGESTFATSNLSIYWNPIDGKFSHLLTVGYYRVGYTVSPIASGVVRFVAIDPVLMSAAIGDLETIVTGITALSGRMFSATVSLTAAAAATPVVILAASEVTGGKKAYVTDFLLSVNGGTAWTDSSGTIVTLQDSAASPVVGATFAKAQLTSQAQLGKLTAGCTLGAPIRTGAGFTANKGLAIAADSDFDAGSTISITVTGYIA